MEYGFHGGALGAMIQNCLGYEANIPGRTFEISNVFGDGGRILEYFMVSFHQYIASKVSPYAMNATKVNIGRLVDVLGSNWAALEWDGVEA